MIETLTIDCIAARAPDGADGLATRVDRIVRRVADIRLEQLLGSYGFAAEGEWCLERVQVDVELDFERPDSALEERLALAVLDAITAAARGPEALHYPNRIAALADLVVAVAGHRAGAAWVWLRLGLIDDAEEFERHPESAVLVALDRSPECALAAIIGAARAVGLPALHRVLGEQGWIRLADIVVEMSADARARTTFAAMVRDGTAGGGSAGRVSGRGNAPGARTAGAASPMVRLESAARVLHGSVLAGEARSSRLRWDGPTARALALLVMAETEPALLCRGIAIPLCLNVADFLSGEVPILMPPGAHEPTTGTRPEGRPGEVPAAPGSIDEAVLNGHRDSGATGGSPVPVGDETDHAGLLFLLNAAADAGQPAVLLDDPALQGFDGSELLARIAMTLAPVSADDPVTSAFAGVDPRRPRPTWRTSLPEPLAARIGVHADSWAAAAIRRLDHPDDDPQRVVAEMICRHGRIAHEPGWIDVHLSLDDVSVDLRRAALDIDPGWVPWLGSVVRFRYE